MLSRFERAVERVVEGSVAGLFRLRVQPAEIGRRLERAMLDGRAASVGVMLAPNVYVVRLHPDDAAVFADWEAALCREMDAWLAEVAFKRGLTTVGPIRVRIAPDPSVPRRSVRATGRFERSPDGATVAAPMLPTLRLTPVGNRFASLRLTGAAPKTVGRAQDNDLVLAHPEISRRHARFERGDGDWRLVDLKSTNGTRLNGEWIAAAPVAVGDEVAFAELRFAIEPG